MTRQADDIDDSSVIWPVWEPEMPKGTPGERPSDNAIRNAIDQLVESLGRGGKEQKEPEWEGME